MAGLTGVPSAGKQLRAVTWLRGRLFLNTFRRKGGKSEVVARFILLPLFSLLAVGPIAGAGVAGFALVRNGQYQFLSLMLWVIFFVWLTFSVSTRAAAPSFDLSMLIRFPLRFPTYLLIRLLFGLMDTPTVICSLALLAAAIGVGTARVSLFPGAALVFLVLDLTLLFFFRMVFLYLDRWFAQRKTREILMGFFFIAMLAFQYVNLTFNGGGSHSHDPAVRARRAQRVETAMHLAKVTQPVLDVLPPGLAAAAFTRVAQGQPARAAVPLLGVAACGAIFLGLFARRLQGEFLGENFNESPAVPAAAAKGLRAVAVPALASPAATPGRSFLSPIVTACLAKEFRYLSRSGPLLFALVTPVFMVFLIVTRAGLTHRATEWLLPTTLSYILLGLTASMYNILGTEGPGVQLYFLAPIRLREVIVAKNLFSVMLITIEMVIASGIVLSTTPPPATPVLVATYLWLAFTITLAVTLGNIRSVYSPRLIDLGKFRQGKQGQINALIGLAVLLVSLAFGGGVLLLSHRFTMPWLPAPVFAVLAMGAFAFYRANLSHLDQLAQDRRETITGELSRT